MEVTRTLAVLCLTMSVLNGAHRARDWYQEPGGMQRDEGKEGEEKKMIDELEIVEVDFLYAPTHRHFPHIIDRSQSSLSVLHVIYFLL